MTPLRVPLLLVALLPFLGGAAASDGTDGLPQSPSIADAMKDPAVVEQAMKMMQNPMVMQQMRVMMQDPRVKERMQRMLERLGGDSSLEGAASLANDPAALDKLFERMQACCPEPRWARATAVATLPATVGWTGSRGQYAAEMKDEVISDHKLAQELGLDDDIQTDVDEEESDDDEEGDDDEA
ncbi:hypothetical protein AB1Y20_009328 [Prymnesium parvum]|uniref:STI1 domain-containing protein n=1 Tax=Prymnesium parvum TaxID=97485 RepID=A0AB34K482_PRYPA